MSCTVTVICTQEYAFLSNFLRTLTACTDCIAKRNTVCENSWNCSTLSAEERASLRLTAPRRSTVVVSSNKVKNFASCQPRDHCPNCTGWKSIVYLFCGYCSLRHAVFTSIRIIPFFEMCRLPHEQLRWRIPTGLTPCFLLYRPRCDTPRLNYFLAHVREMGPNQELLPEAVRHSISIIFDCWPIQCHSRLKTQVPEIHCVPHSFHAPKDTMCNNWRQVQLRKWYAQKVVK